jgi:hypothetical protein
MVQTRVGTNRSSRKVFDDLCMFYNAEPFGTFTVGTKNSASVDLKAADIDELNPGSIVARVPGLDSAGAMTVQLLIADSPDNSSFTTRWTGVAWTKAQAQDFLDDFVFPLSPKDLARYVRISVVIGTANASAGTWYVGLVK